MKKWPLLSPRSAIAKEEAIQALAVLPDDCREFGAPGRRLGIEISYDDTRRLLSGLDD